MIYALMMMTGGAACLNQLVLIRINVIKCTLYVDTVDFIIFYCLLLFSVLSLVYCNYVDHKKTTTFTLCMVQYQGRTYPRQNTHHMNLCGSCCKTNIDMNVKQVLFSTDCVTHHLKRVN